MKFYSETLNKLFESEEALIEAEKQFEEKKLAEKKAKEEKEANRKVAAAEVEKKLQALNEAYNLLADAKKDYRDALNAFCKDYGTYHYSTSDKNFRSMFDLFF